MTSQIELQRPFEHEGDRCFFVRLPQYERLSDSEQSPDRSPLMVYEDGKPLGPAHAMHADIRSEGRGRFSHWGPYLRFSSSDGSSPQSNLREYSVSVSTEKETPKEAPKGRTAPPISARETASTTRWRS